MLQQETRQSPAFRPFGFAGIAFGCTLLLAGASVNAQESDKPASEKPAAVDEVQQKRFEKFEELLTNARLVGQFTILGRDGAPPKEEYTIHSVKKLPEGDYWQFNVNIRYGDTDVTVPLRLEVQWAGGTPMITLTNFTIPGLGTFSSRVLFYKNKYAGTWTHGKVGGHLFGVVVKNEPKKDNARGGESDDDGT